MGIVNMSCTYLRIRTKNYKKYFFCTLCKHETNIEICKCCIEKAYKKAKPMKCKKHSRTKATAIQKNVKEAVWYRDRFRCIFCHTPVPMFNANAHFIPRSRGGKGIEENMFTACDFCHREQDNGLNTEYYNEIAEKHLKSIYGSTWKKENLIYEKYERKEN